MNKKAWGAAGVVALAMLPAGLAAGEETMAERVAALAPELEAYVEAGMKAFDDPGLALGIVVGDKLVYAKGFGVGRKGGAPVDPDTIFQIGSTTKAFLATTLAIGVDRKLFNWDDRVVDLYPEFQLKDPWVTHEFRLFDLMAQRSGLPPYANDFVGMLGFDQPEMIRSLRYVDPVSSFRTTFAYTNITHMVAERIVAKAFGAPDWPSVVEQTIVGPLGMKRTSFTADAIESAENATIGHRYTPDGSIEVPFTPIFPYAFGGAGAINSSVHDLAPWVMLHLDRGTWNGQAIVSPENLAVTKTARVGMNDQFSYAMGWVLQSTPNGMITWHNGGTSAYGAYIGTELDKGVGVIVLTNLVNLGLPDAIGQWTLDRLLGNPEVDYVALKLAAAKEGFAKGGVPDAPTGSTTPPSADKLVGRFSSGTLGDVTIAAEGDALTMTLSTGATLRLDPWDGHAFRFSLVPEGRFAGIAADIGPDALGVAQFLVDPAGGLNALTLTMAEGGQTVDFVRLP